MVVHAYNPSTQEGRLRQEDRELKDSLGYTARLHLQKKTFVRELNSSLPCIHEWAPIHLRDTSQSLHLNRSSWFRSWHMTHGRPIKAIYTQFLLDAVTMVAASNLLVCITRPQRNLL
jgi:hypothetical protein